MEEQRPAQESQVASLRLLVVDHDENLSYLVRKSLEKAGHHVVACSSAEAALNALDHAPFDLVVVREYFVGPEMSGVELLQLLRIRSMPAIMLAGDHEAKLFIKATAAGALDFVAVDRGLFFLSDLSRRVTGALAAFRESTSRTKPSELNVRGRNESSCADRGENYYVCLGFRLYGPFASEANARQFIEIHPGATAAYIMTGQEVIEEAG